MSGKTRGRDVQQNHQAASARIVGSLIRRPPVRRRVFPRVLAACREALRAPVLQRSPRRWRRQRGCSFRRQESGAGAQVRFVWGTTNGYVDRQP